MHHKILSKTWRSDRAATIILSKELDNTNRVSRLDSSKMLEAINDFPGHFLRYESNRGTLSKPTRSRIENIVLMGMGGSASAGDVVLEWLRDTLDIPSFLLREPRLPRYVGRNTLFVGISYSGETLETLTAFRQARKRRAVMVGIGTGGTLASLCDTYGVQFVTVPRTIAPRAALPQLMVGTAAILESAELVHNIKGQVVDSGRDLQRLRNRLRMSIPTAKNPAKQLATKLQGAFVVVYALQRMSSVARRFKNQLAENSKQPAKYDLLPESAHNEIEGWRRSNAEVVPLIIRDLDESTLETRIIEAFADTIRYASHLRPLTFQVRARNPLSRLVSAIFYLDYVSVYLALLRGVDPTPTGLITKYKARSMKASS